MQSTPWNSEGHLFDPPSQVEPGLSVDLSSNARNGDEHRMLAERHLEYRLQEQHGSRVEVADFTIPVVLVVEDSQGFGSHDFVAQQ